MGDKKERFTSPIKSRQFKSPREGKKKRGDDLVLPSRREKKQIYQEVDLLFSRKKKKEEKKEEDFFNEENLRGRSRSKNFKTPYDPPIGNRCMFLF